MAKPFVISPESKIIFEIPPFKGRLTLVLDSEELFEASNKDTNSGPIIRVIESGLHKLHINAYDHGNIKYDVKVNISLQERGSDPLLVTEFSLVSTGEDDVLIGRTIELNVRSN